MQKGLIGKKVGMTQIFDENGKVIPVTVIEVGPCVVVQKKTVESDGYTAVQIGFGNVVYKERKDKKNNYQKGYKPLKGHFDKADVAPKKILREIRMDSVEDVKIGDILKADIFEVGELVDVVGTSKGKGFQGAVKRFNFSIMRKTHGAGPVTRHQGSIGMSATPGKVFKGKKMPGHMGAERTTIQNLTIAKVDVENNLIAIKGALPGAKGGTVCIQNSVKA